MNKPITLCDRCKEYAHCCLNYDGYNCQKIRTVEPTNADWIRAMSDEELAEFISRQIIDRNIGVPVDSWLDWLKKEVDNDKLEIVR